MKNIMKSCFCARWENVKKSFSKIFQWSRIEFAFYISQTINLAFLCDVVVSTLFG